MPGRTVVRARENLIHPSGGIAVLRGNLAPGGATIEHAAASSGLPQHTERAVVLDGGENMTRRVDDPDLDVSADDVLVLRNAGSKGAPGMPEAGCFSAPERMARQGVKDMVRISGACVCGTTSGTVVLHVVPEAGTGGPLALVRNGGWISLDVPGRRIDAAVNDAEVERRRAGRTPPQPGSDRGYPNLFLRGVLQADAGRDFDLLVPGRLTPA